MKPALLLVDLQADYLGASGLEPSAGVVTERAARLLRGFRDAGLPVVHAWTTVDRARDGRMPHWKRAGTWQCVAGTEGHRPPAALEPRPGEAIVHKQFFSAFGDPGLDLLLRGLGVDAVVLAGVHLHACVRATALDAYAHGYRVSIADDATASNDPLHAAITRRYLRARVADFVSVDEGLRTLEGRDSAMPRSAEVDRADVEPLPVAIVDGVRVHRADAETIRRSSPADAGVPLAPVPVGRATETSLATAAARRAFRAWSRSNAASRARLLLEWAARIEADSGLADGIAAETGKPVRYAREEVVATAAQLRAMARRSGDGDPGTTDGKVWVRQRPVGVIAVVTPWNNPAYIPAGKIGAALLHGNAVVWKPAPMASTVALRILRHLQDAGAPSGTVGLVLGDRETAMDLMSERGVDAVTLTGSLAAGNAARDACARRHVPLQAELGGNNAAIVWADADLAGAASALAEGAFAMAGQRCTANRRVVVDARCHDAFLAELTAATARLRVGDPADPSTHVGPLISIPARDRVAACVARARARGATVWTPHGDDRCLPGPDDGGGWMWPTLVLAEDANDEVVRDETFGPVLVVQRAADWGEAIARCNGVDQGLAAALFSASTALHERFLDEAMAGILKLNRSTAGAEVDFPFGGWKSSGIGPPEHGASDREFYTRTQTVYR